ncbi:hypothetical protein [Qipengyuania seohaensis]|nr:hypothetical protein [Qipengyuania seohaensis]
MQITFAIEASQPNGATFRLGMGIAIPVGLILALLSFFGLS